MPSLTFSVPKKSLAQKCLERTLDSVTDLEHAAAAARGSLGQQGQATAPDPTVLLLSGTRRKHSWHRMPRMQSSGLFLTLSPLP